MHSCSPACILRTYFRNLKCCDDSCLAINSCITYFDIFDINIKSTSPTLDFHAVLSKDV